MGTSMGQILVNEAQKFGVVILGLELRIRQISMNPEFLHAYLTYGAIKIARMTKQVNSTWIMIENGDGRAYIC